jgi:hypothetical protein
MAGENVGIEMTTNSQLVFANDACNKIQSQQKLNITPTDSLKIYLEYHESEIKQNEKIYELARKIIWTGFVVMMIGVIACFFGVTTASILTASAGALTEIISGTILVFLTRSSKSKRDYYRQLSFDEECNKYIRVIQNMNISDDKKIEQIDKLIENYCKRRK